MDTKLVALEGMRVPIEGDETMLVSLIAFSESATASLVALSKGHLLPVAGRAKLSSWEHDGVQHHGLSVVAQNVMMLYQLTRKRKQTTEEEQPA